MNKLENKHKALNLDRFTAIPATKKMKPTFFNENDNMFSFSDLNIVGMKVFYYLVNLLFQENGLNDNNFIKISITDIAKKTSGRADGRTLNSIKKALDKITDSTFIYRENKEGNHLTKGLIFKIYLDTSQIKFDDIFFKNIKFFNYFKNNNIFLKPLKTKTEVEIYVEIAALKAKQKKVQKRHITRFFATLIGYKKNKSKNKLSNYKKAFFSLAEKLEKNDNNLRLKIEGNHFYIL